MVNRNWLSTLALFACFFALCVIGLGVFTRLLDAGLGCPDWPGCYGKIVVTQISASTQFVAYKAWAEMIHRYFAGCLSVLMISIFIISLQKKYRKPSNIILSACLILLLSYQIILGMLTVTLKLLPVIVTQHLLGGFLILSIAWLVYLNNITWAKAALSPCPPNIKLFPWALLGLIILFLQITLGAWTSTNYASLSCPDFPFCMNNQSVLSLHFKQAFNIFSTIGINYEGGVLSAAIRQTIQMMHRFGALIFTVYILIFTSIAMPKFKNLADFTRLMYLILSLLTIQLCIGISNVIFKLPLVTAISHTLVAALLLLAMITLNFKLVKAA